MQRIARIHIFKIHQLNLWQMLFTGIQLNWTRIMALESTGKTATNLAKLIERWPTERYSLKWKLYHWKIKRRNDNHVFHYKCLWTEQVEFKFWKRKQFLVHRSMYFPRTSAFMKCHRIGKKLLQCVALTVPPRSFTFLERKTI